MPRPASTARSLTAALLALAAPAQAVEATYAWNLASTAGVVRSNGVTLSYDARARELFVLDGGRVRIFGESGFETFAFGNDSALGPVRDVTTLEGGDVLVLLGTPGLSIVRCNFRGEPTGKLVPRGVPADVARDFSPSMLRERLGKLYLADLRAMTVVVLDLGGAFVTSYDLAAVAGVADRREEMGVRGFAVDYAGNLLFTVQPLFQAFQVSPEGKAKSFGVKGSGPGRFNVVGAIGADERGNVYVADVLRSVVIVFDPTLRFDREFGYRGDSPGNLRVPVDLAVGNGKVFVSQYARRGVSVYDVALPATVAQSAAAAPAPAPAPAP